VNTEVTTALAVAALALGAAGLGFAKDRDQDGAAHAQSGANARERAPFVGAGVPEAGLATRVARRTAAGARVHAAGGELVTIRPGARVTLHDRPRGRELTTIGERTAFGSRAVLPVVRRRPGWIGVLSSVLAPNGSVGWIREDPAKLATGRTQVRVVVDRSARRLDLLRGDRRVMSTTIGVGRPGSETPLGRFAVTDRLSGARYGGSYGCCILALSGHQPRLPAGWRGGDRLAIHGLNGRGSTAGCVAVPRVPLERLMRSVPLGALVTVRP
jgi:hypothetical protein